MGKWSKLELSFKETTGRIEDAMKHLDRLLDFEPDRQDMRLSRLALNAKATETATFLSYYCVMHELDASLDDMIFLPKWPHTFGKAKLTRESCRYIPYAALEAWAKRNWH
jgi:hypothetical protein